MLWLNPAALFALAAVAAPILIHILVQRRADRVAFPTLRFLRPTPLAAIRRHLLDDLPLLAVRTAIVALAAAAMAGPLVVTRPRRDAWNQRVVRAIVAVTDGARASIPVTNGARASVPLTNGARASVPLTNGARAFQASDELRANGTRAYRANEFRGASIADGIRRAIDWLEHAPPARRELVITGPLTIGSVTAADVAAIPANVGVTFERAGTLPPARTAAYGSIRSTTGIIDREVTLDGTRTSVRVTPMRAAPVADAAFPIEIVTSPPARAFADAAISAVLSQRVWSAPASHRARLIVAGDDASGLETIEAGGAIQPWIADAIARMTRDRDLQRAAEWAQGSLNDSRFSSMPWFVVAPSSGGRPLVAAAGSADRLIVVSGAPASELLLPIVVRAIANAIASVPDLTPLEIVAIPDAQLRAWSRPAAAPSRPRIESIDTDDRRWLWVAVLALLGLEMWLRRPGRQRTASAEAVEQIRVA